MSGKVEFAIIIHFLLELVARATGCNMYEPVGGIIVWIQAFEPLSGRVIGYQTMIFGA